MFCCKKHLEHTIMHALSHSNVDQCKLRVLDSTIESQPCEVCKDIAYYQVVPIKFE